MADTKITSLLTPQVTTNPATDVLPIVNIADPLMATSGSTRKITVNQLLGAGGTATLASATITGDLTVDTNTLKVDSANNRVGIGTATPGTACDVASGTVRVKNAVGDLSGLLIYQDTGDASKIFNYYNGSIQFGINNTTAMTLNSTGLGVGVVSANGIKLSSFVTTDGAPATSGTTQTSGSLRIGAVSTTGAMDIGTAGSYSWIQVLDRGNLAINYDLVLQKNGGNVGIGVTPAGAGGCLQLKSGITFPVTQVASSDAKTLDDYEEGTWTIGLTFGGGSTGITTNVNTGRYTKIGRQVTVTGRLQLTNKGSSTGSAFITGLPFTIASGDQSYSAASFRVSAVTYTGAFQSLAIINTKTFNLEQVSTAGVVSALTDANFSNNSDIVFSLTYTV